MSKKLLFYKVSFEKPHIKRLKSIYLLHELPFCHELNIEKISKAFKVYARSYKIEIIDLNDPLVQLETTKSSIKDLLEDSLNEIKGFKYETTAKFLLRNHKGNGDIEFASVYFNSTTKFWIWSW